MGVILSIETFNKLEKKLGTDSAKELYQLAEAIYEEIEGKIDEKLKKSKLDFADDEYKRLTRKEFVEFKTQLLEIKKEDKEQLNNTFQSLISKVRATVNSLLVISCLNLLVLLVILYKLLLK